MYQTGADVSEERTTVFKMEAACLSEKVYLSSTLYNVKDHRNIMLGSLQNAYHIGYDNQYGIRCKIKNALYTEALAYTQFLARFGTRKFISLLTLHTFSTLT